MLELSPPKIVFFASRLSLRSAKLGCRFLLGFEEDGLKLTISLG